MQREVLRPRIYYNHYLTDKFKHAYFSVNFVLPFDSKKVAARQLMCRLLFHGSKKYPTQKELNRVTDELYGTTIGNKCSIAGDSQVISFSVDMLDAAYLPQGETLDVFASSLSVLKSCIFEPLFENGQFRAAYYELDKTNCINDIRAEINNKSRFAYNRMCALMFGDTAAGYPVLGKIEDYEKLTPADVVNAYREMIDQSHVEIFCIGSLSPSDGKKAAYAFTDCLTCTENVAVAQTAVFEGNGAVKRKEDKTATTQSILAMGYSINIPRTSRGNVLFTLFNDIYGGSASSKLFMNVREKRSLCYYCYTRHSFVRSTFAIIAGIDDRNREKTEQECDKQLMEIVNGNITDSEMECAKKSIRDAFRSVTDSTEDIKNWYLFRFLRGHGDSPDEAIAYLDTFTKEELQAVAATVRKDTVYALRGTLPRGTSPDVEEDC